MKKRKLQIYKVRDYGGDYFIVMEKVVCGLFKRKSKIVPVDSSLFCEEEDWIFDILTPKEFSTFESAEQAVEEYEKQFKLKGMDAYKAPEAIKWLMQEYEIPAL